MVESLFIPQSHQHEKQQLERQINVWLTQIHKTRKETGEALPSTKRQAPSSPSQAPRGSPRAIQFRFRPLHLGAGSVLWPKAAKSHCGAAKSCLTFVSQKKWPRCVDASTNVAQHSLSFGTNLTWPVVQVDCIRPCQSTRCISLSGGSFGLS